MKCCFLYINELFHPSFFKDFISKAFDQFHLLFICEAKALISYVKAFQSTFKSFFIFQVFPVFQVEITGVLSFFMSFKYDSLKTGEITYLSVEFQTLLPVFIFFMIFCEL